MSCRHACSQRIGLVLTSAFLIAVCVMPAVGQETTTDQSSVFAPFVSRIRISTRDPEVRLTWQDSTDIDGVYIVYRHTSPITSATFLQAERVGRVQSGVQSFIDAPAEPGQYYYAVVAESVEGEAYEIFIPYRNATATAVAVTNVATVEERAARIVDISAVAESGTILIEYSTDQVGRDIIIYRSTRPIAQPGDLAAAGVVTTQTSAVQSAVDYPVPGVPYYYAAVDSALVADGTVVLRPGQNTTATPVEIPLQAVASRPAEQPAPQAAQPAQPVEAEPEPAAVASAPTAAPAASSAAPEITQTVAATEEVFAPSVSRRRPLPLPFLQLNTDLQTGRSLGDTVLSVPARQNVSRETEDAINTMLSGLSEPAATAPVPQILRDDTLPSPRGSEYTLRTIIDGSFVNMAWEDALLQLDNFLNLPLTGDVLSRAHFYRAQCYYFTEQPRRAFVEFLLARESYFAEVEGWLDIILSDSTDA